MKALQIWLVPFKKFDLNQNRTICFGEIRKVFEEQGRIKIFEKHVKKFVKFSDKDKNGVLNHQEFLEVLQHAVWSAFLDH